MIKNKNRNKHENKTESDVWFDEDLGVVRMRFVGDITNEEYKRINREFIASIPADKRKLQLVDLSASTAMKIDRKTRKELAEEMSTTDVAGTKTAIIGASPVVRMVTRVFQAMRKQKDAETRFFKTEEEAIAWLKGE